MIFVNPNSCACTRVLSVDDVFLNLQAKWRLSLHPKTAALLALPPVRVLVPMVLVLAVIDQQNV
jgi:hypothetical protein